MERTEHIEQAERLLETAKDVMKRKKETAEDRKNDEVIMLDLLAFANCHANIARAIGRTT